MVCFVLNRGTYTTVIRYLYFNLHRPRVARGCTELVSPGVEKINRSTKSTNIAAHRGWRIEPKSKEARSKILKTTCFPERLGVFWFCARQSKRWSAADVHQVNVDYCGKIPSISSPFHSLPFGDDFRCNNCAGANCVIVCPRGASASKCALSASAASGARRRFQRGGVTEIGVLHALPIVRVHFDYSLTFANLGGALCLVTRFSFPWKASSRRNGGEKPTAERAQQPGTAETGWKHLSDARQLSLLPLRLRWISGHGLGMRVPHAAVDLLVDPPERHQPEGGGGRDGGQQRCAEHSHHPADAGRDQGQAGAVLRVARVDRYARGDLRDRHAVRRVLPGAARGPERQHRQARRHAARLLRAVRRADHDGRRPGRGGQGHRRDPRERGPGRRVPAGGRPALRREDPHQGGAIHEAVRHVAEGGRLRRQFVLQPLPADGQEPGAGGVESLPLHSTAVHRFQYHIIRDSERSL